MTYSQVSLLKREGPKFMSTMVDNLAISGKYRCRFKGEI